jgi:hypothetical protein
MFVRGAARDDRSDESAGGRVRARSGARRPFRRIRGAHRELLGLRGVARSPEPALLAERSKDCAAKASIE